MKQSGLFFRAKDMLEWNGTLPRNINGKSSFYKGLKTSNVKVQGPEGSADFLTFYVRGPYDFEFWSGVDNVASCKDSKNIGFPNGPSFRYGNFFIQKLALLQV